MSTTVLKERQPVSAANFLPLARNAPDMRGRGTLLGEFQAYFLAQLDRHTMGHTRFTVEARAYPKPAPILDLVRAAQGRGAQPGEIPDEEALRKFVEIMAVQSNVTRDSVLRPTAFVPCSFSVVIKLVGGDPGMPIIGGAHFQGRYKVGNLGHAPIDIMLEGDTVIAVLKPGRDEQRNPEVAVAREGSDFREVQGERASLLQMSPKGLIMSVDFAQGRNVTFQGQDNESPVTYELSTQQAVPLVVVSTSRAGPSGARIRSTGIIEANDAPIVVGDIRSFTVEKHFGVTFIG